VHFTAGPNRFLPVRPSAPGYQAPCVGHIGYRRVHRGFAFPELAQSVQLRASSPPSFLSCGTAQRNLCLHVPQTQSQPLSCEKITPSRGFRVLRVTFRRAAATTPTWCPRSVFAPRKANDKGSGRLAAGKQRHCVRDFSRAGGYTRENDKSFLCTERRSSGGGAS
jgi:hypothetical protein